MSARALCGVILEKSLDLEKKVFHFLFINRRELCQNGKVVSMLTRAHR
jgi:hypothetical protein